MEHTPRKPSSKSPKRKKKSSHRSDGHSERQHRSSPSGDSPSSVERSALMHQSKKQKSPPQLERASETHSLLKDKSSHHSQSSGISSTVSGDLSSPVISVTKSLAQLQAVPGNRSCAECRSPLLDSSQTFVSFTPSLGKLPSSPHMPSAVGEFSYHHDAFAPPGSKAKSEPLPVDPAIQATQLVGSFGVFVCAACGAAHKSLGSSIANVHSVIDTSWWSPEQVEFLVTSGGNARSWAVFERYLPKSWEKLRPNNTSTHAQRQMFVRTKYDALAFLTPQGGPLAGPAWSKLVKSKPELQRWATKELENFQRITVSERESSHRLGDLSSDALPSRLVDFFCVVGPSGKLTQAEVNQNLAERNSPEELCFDVAVTDCYPAPDGYNDMDFPEHVSTFVFPDGCRPSQIQRAPSFFTFVLTSANGQRIYGAAMHVYDDQMDTDDIRNVIVDSGYTVPLPWWLHNEPGSPSSPSSRKPARKRPSEVVYLPKCLVVLSHYPFFDILRRFLTQLYRITMVEAPLPIERYIANFVSEVPLPPQGRVEVKFSFTVGDLWSIKRPPVNELPLSNFSYLPLFSSLSVGNILIVSGCLLQETRVALLSSHYALLAPVAEALLSLLFPFEWQGMYIPIMPFAMLDILDAPVPFLVGLHSRYLTYVPQKYRPQGVVFVNLDKDEVHLGFDDAGTHGHASGAPPRFPPALPEKDVVKLKAKLDEFGGTAYLFPSTKVKGRVLTGDGNDLQNSTRPSYSQWETVDLKKSAMPRMQTFSNADNAFPDGKQLDPISGFLSEHGHTSGLSSRDDTTKSASRTRSNPLKKLGRRVDFGRSGSNGMNATASILCISLLEMEEPEGFSSMEIRNAFLRFFVSIFSSYEKYLVKDSGSKCFRSEEFLASLNLPSGSHRFVASVLATQMFQRFVQERQAHPSNPTVLFFDQSIIAKNNRSKKTTLTTGGKQKTPFLDDTSMKIQEVFTPPPPSNWGLPDGRRYQYGGFPSLNASLFGKVRSPKQWPQQDAGTYRTVTTAALKKQQELIAKAIGPGSPVPALVAGSKGRSGVRDVEWAVRVLSRDDNREQSKRKDGGGKIESRASAQQQVLAARRKQGILVGVIVKLQSFCRMFLARRRYEEHKKALIKLQRMSRRTSPEKDQQEFRDTIECAVIMQALVRLYLSQKRYKKIRSSTIVMQRAVRGAAARQQYKEMKAAVLLQRWIRGSMIRHYVSRLRQSTVKTQAMLRGRRTRFGCALLMTDISKAQALCRGHLTRKLVSSLVKKRTGRFKQQIFLLWQHAHTPLAYRTKMWPLLDGAGFLSLTLAEGELERLWTELDVKCPPSSPKSNSLLKSDQHLAMAHRVGLSNPCYLRFVKVQAMIEAGKQREGSIPWFTAEGSPHWKKAAEREKLERLQVYERLHAMTDTETLKTIYEYFEIAPGDKTKKRKLVDRLWDEQTHASRSASVMVALFPELEYGTYMNFVSPSKKGQKLYHVKNQVPSPLDSSMQVEVVRNQLIKTNLKEFAMAYAEKVPGLLLRLDDCEKEKKARFLLQQRAEMYARKTPEWRRCRRKIILDFLYPGRKKKRKTKRSPR